MARNRLSGGCLCGQVRYEVAGAPLNVRVCHCRVCQKATGQAFFARAVFSRGAVSVTGETRAYMSSPALARHFCPTCGTPVFSERDEMDIIALALGTLDEPEALRPQMNIFTATELSWVAGIETLPKFAAAAP